MQVAIRPATPADAGRVSELVMHEFNRFIANHYDPTGRKTFVDYVTAQSVAARLGGGAQGIVAVLGPEIVGYVEMRGDHISLLFVTTRHHREGIGRSLLDYILATRPDADITVNSGPYSKSIYERLGFRPTGDWTIKDGIRFLPMVRKASRSMQAAEI